MGRHASAERRRSVAAWPIIVGVLVLLLVVATVGYFRVIADDDGQTAGCSGSTVLPVVVGPGAAPTVEQAAKAFNATKPEARSTCVAVSVTTLAGPAAVTALADGWRGRSTPAPGLWIADSAADVAALDAASPAMTAGHPTKPLASSPVVLAVRQPPAGPPLTWASLANGSGDVVLGIADPTTNRASAAALQSLVRGASGTPTARSAIDAAAVTAAEPALARLAGGSSTVPATTELALTELAAGTSRYTAVPVVESALASFNAAKGTALQAVYPTGPTGADEVMPVPLTAAWVSNAMSDAAAAFDGYLTDAPGTKILTAAHLRTAAAPVAAGGLDLRTPVTTLADATAPARSALAAAWRTAVAGTTTQSTGPTATTIGGSTGATVSGPSAAVLSSTVPSSTAPGSAAARTTTSVAPTSKALALPPAITFLVDISASMSTIDDGAQRLTWVKSAVSTVVQQRPGVSFGLRTFATGITASIPVGPAEELISGTPRSSAMVDALNRSIPGGDSYSYGAVRTALTEAGTGAKPGSAQRVILLTDGADSTPALTRDSIRTAVAALVASHPGLELDIVGLSSSVNAQALIEIATAGGGTFTPVPALAGLKSTLLALSS